MSRIKNLFITFNREHWFIYTATETCETVATNCHHALSSKATNCHHALSSKATNCHHALSSKATNCHHALSSKATNCRHALSSSGHKRWTLHIYTVTWTFAIACQVQPLRKTAVEVSTLVEERYGDSLSGVGSIERWALYHWAIAAPDIWMNKQSVNQWFPTFFISRPHSKIWHSRSAPAINCNIKVFK